MRFIARFVIVPWCLLACGCGSGGNTNNSQTLSLTAGNWQVNAVSTTNPGARSLGGGTSLNQTGTNVSGIMHLLFLPCFNLIMDININGTVNGPTLNLTSDPVNGQTLSVSATGSERSLSGSYALSGASCAPADQGTITATLVPPATGSWHGTLTSVNGQVTQVAATLMQSGPDAHGFFAVSGTVTFSGTCLSSGTISSSLVNGGSYVFTVQPSDPGVSGDVLIAGSMTDPATAIAFSGFYSSLESTCADNGTGSLSKS